MKNLWIARITGRLVEEAVAEPLGSEQDAMREPERRSREDYDEETGQRPSVNDVPSETVVDTLLQAWHNGQRNEVAAQILLTPVSYADFAKFVYAIGQEDAVQLGLMLDDMAASEGINDASHDRVMDRVQHPRTLAAGPAEAPGPTGDTPEPTSDAEPLPPPPVEPEEEPHEVGNQLESKGKVDKQAGQPVPKGTFKRNSLAATNRSAQRRHYHAKQDRLRQRLNPTK